MCPLNAAVWFQIVYIGHGSANGLAVAKFN